MPRRIVKTATEDPHWARLGELSAQQAQRSMYGGMIVAVLSLGAVFFALVWAGVGARRFAMISSWPTGAIASLGIGVMGLVGGVVWFFGAMTLKSRWERDIRRLRTRGPG